MNQKGFAPILIIVIVAVAAGLGGWYLVKRQVTSDKGQGVLQNNTPQATTPPSVAQQPSQPSAPDVSNWQTYRNEKYGFEVKYPQDWEFEDISNRSCPPANCLFSLTKRSSNQGENDLDFHDGVGLTFSATSSFSGEIESYVAYYKGYPGGKDFLAYEFQGSSENESDYQVSAFRKLPNGSVVIANWGRVGNTTEDLSYDKFLTQILSTFKFIK